MLVCHHVNRGGKEAIDHATTTDALRRLQCEGKMSLRMIQADPDATVLCSFTGLIYNSAIVVGGSCIYSLNKPLSSYTRTLLAHGPGVGVPSHLCDIFWHFTIKPKNERHCQGTETMSLRLFYSRSTAKPILLFLSLCTVEIERSKQSDAISYDIEVLLSSFVIHE